MTDQVQQPELDKKAEELLSEKIQTADEVIAEAQTTEKIENKGSTDQTNLGDLGSFPNISQEEIEKTLDKLHGTLFRVEACLFRVIYTNKQKGRFAAEIINEKA